MNRSYSKSLLLVGIAVGTGTAAPVARADASSLHVPPGIAGSNVPTIPTAARSGVSVIRPADNVDAANRAALREPGSHNYLNAVQVYPYSAGALYRVFAAPERVTDIMLEPGETLIAVAAGDTVRWTVGDTASGAGETRRTHILVKPLAPGLSTNVVITTDRRAYHLLLSSTAASAMTALSWTYPEDALLALRRAEAAAAARTPAASGLMLEDLSFGYTISGDSPVWRPQQVFDDGRQTFIAFAPAIAASEAPPLFVLDAKGSAMLVNYRMTGRYYIVDRLFDVAELRLGEKPQTIVRIVRDGQTGKRRRPS
ncbi:P-type conjugative transfer protein TrbG [Sphingosinicella microcystinivorans]|uniref:P-type conjugative transfer protein TrbG n=1 Tax=Sphingosinicella microcystinivorans TaxID=335406 RepID=UPI00183A386B|nr:P-type conjugative transfer protein TrbG [Sphingosinicella microcystinivorans]MBA4757300.1 P-type conjugative transfer protein TrbG [Sphingosinicella sp.]WBX83989.1 P-type conjugative transfer protein TrbG [Sphingosinicella microcystinivorans]